MEKVFIVGPLVDWAVFTKSLDRGGVDIVAFVRAGHRGHVESPPPVGARNAESGASTSDGCVSQSPRTPARKMSDTSDMRP